MYSSGVFMINEVYKRKTRAGCVHDLKSIQLIPASVLDDDKGGIYLRDIQPQFSFVRSNSVFEDYKQGYFASLMNQYDQGCS